MLFDVTFFAKKMTCKLFIVAGGFQDHKFDFRFKTMVIDIYLDTRQVQGK